MLFKNSFDKITGFSQLSAPVDWVFLIIDLVRKVGSIKPESVTQLQIRVTSFTCFN